MMLAAWCSHQFRVLCLADLQSHSPEIILGRQHTGREYWLIIICTIRSINNIGDGAHRAWWIAYTLPRLLLMSVDFGPVLLRTSWDVGGLHPVHGTSCFLMHFFFSQLKKFSHSMKRTCSIQKKWIAFKF